jgi:phage/plasmid-associated DNA primase
VRRQSWFNILISSNSCLKLSINSDRSAWERRLVVIRFERPYTGRKIVDIHLLLLDEEGPGILNWILEGAQKLLRDIELKGDICFSARHQSLIDRLLNESDSLAIFLTTSIVHADHGEAKGLSTADIVDTYLGYCEKQGWDPMRISVVEKKLPDLMAKLFATQQSHNLQGGLRGFRRVRWKNHQ